MLARRETIEIPEFYVGSLMAVTVSDTACPHPNKLARFVGICIDRGGCGLRAWFILRNVVEGQGVEFMYQMYNPTLVKMEVLRLERRLDDELYYLRYSFVQYSYNRLNFRDAPPEYSTVPFDLEPEILPEDSPVPLNNTGALDGISLQKFILLCSGEAEPPPLVQAVAGNAELHPRLRADKRLDHAGQSPETDEGFQVMYK